MGTRDDSRRRAGYGDDERERSDLIIYSLAFRKE